MQSSISYGGGTKLADLRARELRRAGRRERGRTPADVAHDAPRSAPRHAPTSSVMRAGTSCAIGPQRGGSRPPVYTPEGHLEDHPWMAAAVALVPCCGPAAAVPAATATARCASSMPAKAPTARSTSIPPTRCCPAPSPEGAGSYVTLGAGTYTLKLKRNGSSTTVNSTDRSVAVSTSHTLLAHSTADTLRSVFLTDNETAPTSGAAWLRVFNASIEAGALDVYVTASSATLADSSPTVSALGTERFSSYNEISAGSYRVRVTGSGDKTDLRLDVDGISLADQRIGTLVLTTTPGGVLVNSLFIDQSTVTGVANPSARIRRSPEPAATAPWRRRSTARARAGCARPPSAPTRWCRPAA